MTAMAQVHYANGADESELRFVLVLPALVFVAVRLLIAYAALLAHVRQRLLLCVVLLQFEFGLVVLAAVFFAVLAAVLAAVPF